MAVVQISKIQVRRGQKNIGTGLPQLASGEIGWAIDTRELFIGNGAVSEGAPAVGNTKVLTQYDDLFQLAGLPIRTMQMMHILLQAQTVLTLLSVHYKERLDDRTRCSFVWSKG